ncbi:MAG TPA: type II toxin-antitoxin system RelE/ParE family toxin [Azospirillaceae bacterium]|nr:type II toxin-antitoxin system RelE/ParE family toxin [Azospirillaceae bacterium]
MKLAYEAAAAAAFLSMPRKDALALRAKLETFAADPFARYGWARSFGGGAGRIRHGDWRALYRIDQGVMTVFVVKIGNRKEAYR